MKTWSLAAAAAVAIVLAAMSAPQGVLAQEQSMAYSTMDVDAEVVEIVNFKLKSIGSEGGAPVTITLHSKDPNQPPLKLTATVFRFEYASEDDESPSSVVLEGGVRVDSAQGAITAKRGEMSMAKREVLFTGGCDWKMPEGGTMKSDSMAFDMASGNITIKGNVSGRNIPAGAMGGEESAEEAPEAEGAVQ